MLLFLLPLSSLVLGTAALLRTWGDNPRLQDVTWRALAAIPGFRSQLVPSKPKHFGGTPLKAVQTTATGSTKPGRVPERATLIVLRRDRIVARKPERE